MIDEDGYPKLIDFGTAKIFSGRTYTTLGTPHYMAPEIIIRNGYNSSVDLWSLGIMMYEIIFGKVPFGSEEEDTKVIYEKILENKLDLRQSPYNGINYKSFIKQLLSINPAARMGGSIEKLRSHPWFMNFNWKRLNQRKLKPPYVPKVVDYNTVIAFDKTIQEHIGDIEFSEAIGTRRVSLVEPDDWDLEF
jgi:cGMP-dependent protein kinase